MTGAGPGHGTTWPVGEEEPALPPQTGMAGVPDPFQRLWTPHRMVYVDGGDKPADSSPEECPFCQAPGKDDETGLVVARGRWCYAVLNLYPYNPGHLLICPYRHVADYVDLTSAEREELGEMKAQAMTVIRRVSKPAGFNLGMNQGAAAGAGIEAHLHEHVVPRWTGDANFLPIIATTRALPVVLGDTWRLLHEAWPPMDERSSAC